ncbi:MAG: ribonuclease III domain-containing protein [Clostridia bacterium]
MKDYLRTVLEPDAVFGMSMLGLAHIGDAVYELLIRTRECERGVATAKKLHQNTVKQVSAGAQAAAADKIMPLLSDDENDVFRRGRNAKVQTVPKGASCDVYHKATALEGLFGYLYLSGRYDRINALFEAIIG